MPNAALLERLRSGRSAVVLGGVPDLPETIAVIRVRCDGPATRDRLERACETAGRLDAGAPGQVVVVLDGAEAADAATHAFITQLLRQPAKMRTPLMLVVRDEPPASFRSIVDALDMPAPEVATSTGLGDRLDRVARLVRAGDVKEASVELSAVLDAIASLPPGEATTTLSARAMLERARLRWLGAGVDPVFTLDGALESALEARAALGEIAPAPLRADIAAVIAGIAYDLGDGASIEHAQQVLAETVAGLLRDGATVAAAMLLNDQAALELRIGRGDSARALAVRSLVLLGARVKEAPTDAAARADLAGTHHLLARLPLHGSTDARTPDSITTALTHARDADAEYRLLGMRRDVGRVIETRARLEAKRGNVDVARIGFESALKIADETADLTGLARVTAGLAELLASAGKARDALGLLASSIELNREKASPIGLAFDERTLARIEDAIHAMPERDAALAAQLERTRARLARALDIGESEVTPWTA